MRLQSSHLGTERRFRWRWFGLRLGLRRRRRFGFGRRLWRRVRFRGRWWFWRRCRWRRWWWCRRWRWLRRWWRTARRRSGRARRRRLILRSALAAAATTAARDEHRAGGRTRQFQEFASRRVRTVNHARSSHGARTNSMQPKALDPLFVLQHRQTQTGHPAPLAEESYVKRAAPLQRHHRVEQVPCEARGEIAHAHWRRVHRVVTEHCIDVV